MVGFRFRPQREWWRSLKIYVLVWNPGGTREICTKRCYVKLFRVGFINLVKTTKSREGDKRETSFASLQTWRWPQSPQSRLAVKPQNCGSPGDTIPRASEGTDLNWSQEGKLTQPSYKFIGFGGHSRGMSVSCAVDQRSQLLQEQLGTFLACDQPRNTRSLILKRSVKTAAETSTTFSSTRAARGNKRT